MKKPHLIAGLGLLAIAVLAHRTQPERTKPTRIEPVAEIRAEPGVEIPAPEPPPEREVARRLKDYVMSRDAALEKEILERLDRLAPHEVVDLLIDSNAPLAVSLLLARLDRGLREDIEAWSLAVVRGCESCAEDVLRLERFAEVMAGRVRDDGIAMLLLKRDRPELAARFGAPADVRKALWQRVPSPAAIEALGYVIEPDEAVRLSALGDTPQVRRALERAYDRTKSPIILALMR